MVLDLVLSNLPLFLTIAGAAAIIAEAFAPGAHFFVVGVALFVAGLVGFVLPFGGSINLFIMSLVVIGTAIATLFAYRRMDIWGGTGEGKTKDSASLRGKTGRVTDRVTPTDGEVKVEEGGFNPYYQARSVDGEIAEGEEVIVIDPGGGNVLTVEAFSNVKDEIDRELERDQELSEKQSAE
ncbi:protease [Halobacteriales archaeon QH_7_66_37]|nr:MAG: protease [Halobacteriales archaeon QH_7_66_37]